MKRKPVLYLGATSLALVIAGGVGLMVSEHTVSAQAPARGTAPAGRRGGAGSRRGATGGGAPTYRVNRALAAAASESLGARRGQRRRRRQAGSRVDRASRRRLARVGRESDDPDAADLDASAACRRPSVMEFDSAGRVIASWGGPGLGFVWPQSTGGIAVDGDGNVWIAAFGLEPAPAGRGRGAADPDAVGPPPAAARSRAGPARGRGAAPAAPAAVADAHVTKYSRSGTVPAADWHARDAGWPRQPDAASIVPPAWRSTTPRMRCTSPTAAIIAWSCSTRRPVRSSGPGAVRAIVRPRPARARTIRTRAPSRQFRDVTCVKVAKDGMVYVCDRMSNRIQVFQKNGTFVKEMIIAKETRGAVTTIGQAPGIVLNSAGSVWDIAFSSDAGQRYLFVADGHNDRIRDPAARHARRSRTNRRRRTSSRVDSSRRQRWRSIRAAISTPVRYTTRSACRSSRRRRLQRQRRGTSSS